ncbi:bifunctional glycosyltransferase family 2/GtrA family protein [Candidatus Parcubacteria bacterium]|nr:bifunctional glycosyltransferase family 2/GtrA family protein [Candidatus Parcubacteria bacterium]
MKSGRPEKDLLLSIIVPTYNEEKTLKELLDRVERAPLPANISREIIVVDDGSTDRTLDIIKYLPSRHVIIQHERNRGKGASVIDGLRAAKGDFVIIQDADLEYDPNDYAKLLAPILDGKADVVYGSRFLHAGRPSGMRSISKMANRLLTFWSNLFTGLRIEDMETCYKMFSRPVVDAIKMELVSQGFSIEPEMTARIKKFRIVEVPISYYGRSVLEGKKVKWQDGVSALYDIARFNTPERGRAVAFFLVAGAIGAGTNILLLYILTSVFGFWYILSATASFMIALGVSFYLQKFWAFADASRERLPGQVFTYLLVGLLNLAANDAILYILVERLRMHYVLAQACASAIIAVWSFFAYKRLFRK